MTAGEGAPRARLHHGAPQGAAGTLPSPPREARPACTATAATATIHAHLLSPAGCREEEYDEKLDLVALYLK